MIPAATRRECAWGNGRPRPIGKKQLGGRSASGGEGWCEASGVEAGCGMEWGRRGRPQLSNPSAGTGAKGTTRRRREESSALLPRLNGVETFITCMYCASSISPRGLERVPPRLRSSDSPDARLHCVPVPLTGLAAADVRRACTRSEAHGRAVPTGVRAAGAGTWFSLGSHYSPLPCLPPPPSPAWDCRWGWHGGGACQAAALGASPPVSAAERCDGGAPTPLSFNPRRAGAAVAAARAAWQRPHPPAVQ